MILVVTLRLLCTGRNVVSAFFSYASEFVFLPTIPKTPPNKHKNKQTKGRSFQQPVKHKYLKKT